MLKCKTQLSQAIARFPDTTFIWKYENLEDDFAKDAVKVKNLELATWMPQVDILSEYKNGGERNTKSKS